ncbi:hypothetical protein CIT292_10368 [Citrobacter youngae ATCC 29220]|uniref:Uncharacterized protein n=1 Tax=Citrobacter youngae ATCC 29220 TaxID=500640 RepID=D4BIK2_9ENTR|nr:hypothetical protein CIT292_10368 [Citrobacter youngae ATCC 29220]
MDNSSIYIQIPAFFVLINQHLPLIIHDKMVFRRIEITFFQ